MEMNFCRRCSKSLAQLGGKYICPNNHSIYLNPKPTVGIFLLNQNSASLLLSRRGIEPHKGKIDCIGGFVDMNETFEKAALRELQEETGLTNGDTTKLEYLCSAPSNYPFEGEDLQVLSVFFTCTLHSTAQPVPQDDVAELVEINIDSINLDTIATDDVKFGIIKLKEILQV